MPAPYTYDVTQPDPFAGFISGLKLGAGVEQIEIARQERAFQEQQRALAEQERLRVERQRQELQATTERLFSTDPASRLTSADLGRLALTLPKDQFAQLEAVLKSQSEAQQMQSFAFPAQVYSAYLQNDPKTVKGLFDTQIRANEESGKADVAQALRAFQQAYDINPNMGIAMLTSPLMATASGRTLLEQTEKRAKAPIEFAQAEAQRKEAEAKAIQQGVLAEFAPRVATQNLSKITAEAIEANSKARFADLLNQANINKSNWDIANLQSQIANRTQQLKLDEANIRSQIAERFAKTQDLISGIPEGARKPINDAFVQGALAKQQEGQYNILASRITNIGTAWGRFGSFDESLKRFTGNENAITELRQEYTRLRNNAAIQSLPPGPATDRDIQLALSGFPTETGNPQIIASFLRGVAKMKGIESAIENAKAEWLANNRGLLGRATTTFIAGDYRVQPGETFADLTKRIAEITNQNYLSPEQRAEQERQRRVGQIPAGGAPGQQPAMPQRQIGPAPVTPGTVDVMNLADQIIRGQR